MTMPSATPMPRPAKTVQRKMSSVSTRPFAIPSNRARKAGLRTLLASVLRAKARPRTTQPQTSMARLMKSSSPETDRPVNRPMASAMPVAPPGVGPPAVVGFLIGIGFMLLLDSLIPHLHTNSARPEGRPSAMGKNLMLMLAVTLHNIPEGMAVGIVLAGMLNGNNAISASGAIALAVGIAIQNFPEGAIISAPLAASGTSKGKAFACGTLSGVAEPVGAILTILVTSLVTPVLPYILAFAAGAMIYVVIEELIPESRSDEHSNVGTVGAALGFALMMLLDVALG